MTQASSKTLTDTDLNPVIRGANYFTMKNINFGPRYNYGYQLVYVFEGTGKGVIDGSSYQLESGAFFMYGPGDLHNFQTTPGQQATLGTIYFSWQPISTEQLKLKNKSVTELSSDFYALADSSYIIDGLPTLPFMLPLPADRKLAIESLIKNIGESFSILDNSVLQLHHKSLFIELIFQLQQCTKDQLQSKQHHKISLLNKFIERHYQTNISRKDAAKALAISESYLTTLLRKELGTNFTDHLNQFRLNKAMELVRYSDMMVKEIANQTGYKDVSYFVYSFKKKFGHPPMQFR